jgi:hypothetical protein
VDNLNHCANHFLSTVVLLDMRRAAFQSRISRSAAVLAALLTFGWIAPSRALATCGDYIAMPGHHGQPAAEAPDFASGTPRRGVPAALELPQLLSEKLVRTDTSPPQPCRQCPAAPGQAPCPGPWCSGSHSPLTVPPTTVEGPRQDNAVCWAAPRCSDSETIPHAFLDEQVARIHHVLPIYHPPR